MGEYDRWQAALDGQKLDLGERGDPPCGFYRRWYSINKGESGWEAIAVFKDDGGITRCIRNKFGDGSKLDPNEIDELFARDIYAVPYEIYRAVAEEGQEWPAIYQTGLTYAEIGQGIVWTEELGQKKIAATREMNEAENPRAKIGGNNPPDDLPLERRIADRIASARDRVAEWLKGIGGAPKTKEEADKVANYATKFGSLHAEAQEAFETEKRPWLEGGRAVDAKWRFRGEAEELRKHYLKISNKWIDDEKDRLAKEARIAHEAALKAAQQEAEATGEPVAEIVQAPPPKVTVGTTKAVSQRARKVWVITDLPAFSAYLAAMENPPADFIEACQKIANRLGAAKVAAPGITEDEVRSAA